MILDCVKQAIKSIGIYNITIGRIYTYLNSALSPDIPIPKTDSIKLILNRHFHMRYRLLDPASSKYYDPTYNEKRLWTARLLS